MTGRRVVAVVLAAALFVLAVPAAASPAQPPSGTWSHPVGQYATITITSRQSQAVWPVARAVRIWGAGLVFAATCPTSGHCVHVTAGNLPGNAAGETFREIQGRRILAASVVLNRGTEHAAYALRLEVTLHELGHVLGLNHDPHGVMMATADGSVTRPTSAERAILRRIYIGPPPVPHHHRPRGHDPILHL